VATYLLIETGGPWRGPGCARFLSDAAGLAAAGHDVQVVLLQDGVAAALPGAVAELTELIERGAEVLADDFSLMQRGLWPDRLLGGVKVASMGDIAERVIEPKTRVVWR
jgi:predicted peroxiredoxin